MPEVSSANPSAAPVAHYPEQEPDLRSIRVVLIVGAVFIVLTLLFGAWAALTVNARTGRLFTPDHPGPDPEVLERSVIEFGLYALEAPGLEHKTRDRERLQSYGWVDEEQGVAHVPIDFAMQRTLVRLQGQRAQQHEGEGDE